MTSSTTADREILISRTVHAPRALVFQALSEAHHLDQYWGPDGFTNTTHSMDFREGGSWVYVMHGPDGTDWDNWIGYRRIVPNERIEYLHGSRPDDPGAFEGSITLEERDGATEVTLRTVFASKAVRDQLVREVGAIEGGQQTLAHLAAYVEGRQEQAG